MADFSVPIPWKQYRKYCQNEYTSPSSGGTVYCTYSVEEGKTSVNTGCFVPGVYRVNPYRVSSCYVDYDYSIDKLQADYRYYSHNVCFDRRTVVEVNPFGSLLFQFNDRNPPTVGTAYRQLALQKAHSKVGSAELDLGEDLGELRETYEMLRSPLKSLRKFLLDDRARNYMLLEALKLRDKRMVNRLLGRTGKASAETMSSTWLELRYGLRPLYKLVQDAIEMINDKSIDVFDPNKIRSMRTKLDYRETVQHSVDNVIGLMKINSLIVSDDVITATASVQYTQKAQNTLVDQLGLTPRHLPETAWNLTKLSFVWDWIFSIGPWLGTLRINPDVTILGNTTGIRIKRKVYYRKAWCWGYYDPPSTQVLYEPEDVLYLDSYDRAANTDERYMPHFTWGRTLDCWKAIDALTLIWQFASKHRK